MRIMMRVFAVVFCMASVFCAICNCSFVTDEESLRTDLLGNYSKKVRPDLKTRVYVGLVLTSLTSLDIASQSMTVVTLIQMEWTDSRLVWIPANYGGLDSFVTDPVDVWTPPIIIENAVQQVGSVVGSDNNGDIPLKISHSGHVSWNPPVEITTSCEMAIAYYPFDTQHCTIILTGMTYAVTQMEPSALAIDSTTLYTKHGEFDLMHTAVFESDVSQTYTQNNTYRKLHFELTVRRKWPFYGQNLILPVVLNSIMMNVVFVLPIDSGEKMGYCLTVLLSYVVFMGQLAENLPPVSTEISILQVYISIVLVMGCLATVLTTWVLHLYHTNPDKPMGIAYRTIASKLLMPFSECIHCRCVKKTKVEDENMYEQELPNRGVKVKVSPMPTRSSSGVSKFSTDTDHNRASHGFETSTNVSHYDSKEVFSFEKDEPETRKDDSRGRETTPTYTWKELAELCDVFFLWTFAGVLFLLTVIVISLLHGFY